MKIWNIYTGAAIASVAVVLAVGAAGVKTSEAQVIKPTTPYQQCMREMRDICWADYPAGPDRIQCIVDADVFCEGHYG